MSISRVYTIIGDANVWRNMTGLNIASRDVMKKAEVNVSRPLLLILPASGSASRPQTYNFIEAVSTLPPVFTDESLGKIFAIVGGRHKGALRDHFVVLGDDDRERCQGLARRPRGPTTAAPSSSSTSVSMIGGRVFGDGSGMW